MKFMPSLSINLRVINMVDILREIREVASISKNTCAICRLIRFDIISRILNDKKVKEYENVKAISDGLSLNDLNYCSDEVDLQSIALNYMFSENPIFTPIVAFDEAQITDFLSHILDLNIEPLPNMLTLTLANVGQIIHPGIMYGIFKGKEGIAYKKNTIPLFYQGVTEEIAKILKTVSDEILTLTEKIKSLNRSVNLENVKSLKDRLLDSYKGSIADESTLQKCFNTNSAYQGLLAPVKRKGDDFYPDFQARYLTEDVPFGLIVTKSIAQLVKVETPMIDEIILTISKWIGKEYLKKGKLTGKDIGDTRIPQKYGIKKFEKIMMY